MRILVFNDLHLKPNASDYDVDAMRVPDDADLAIILGDLTHRASPEDIELASTFVDQLGPDLPVVYVPGNHDHAPAEEQAVESLSWAKSGHKCAHEFDDLTVIGLGCEERSLSLDIDLCSYGALDPRDAPLNNRRYAADEVANDLEAACHTVICGSATREEAANTLGIADSERASFYSDIEEIRENFESINELLDGVEDVILATHVPPFNTSFDRHHAVGTREEDREYLHVGSIATKLAIRENDVFAALSGHSHEYGYDAGDCGDGRPHCLNLGYRGMGEITINPSSGQFAFSRMNSEVS